jgi:hypothetical protein
MSENAEIVISSSGLSTSRLKAGRASIYSICYCALHSSLHSALHSVQGPSTVAEIQADSLAD